MVASNSTVRALRTARRGLLPLLLLACCGCATLLFEATREAKYVNMDSEVVHVEYGEEKHTEELPNGGSLVFDKKVRLRLPDGKRVILYQTVSPSGVLYASKDKKYLFFERGPCCMLIHDRATVFEGVYCRP